MATTLVIRCDASSERGLGHFVRCLALADAWVTAGGRAVFAMRADRQIGVARARAAGHRIASLLPPVGDEDPKRLIEVALAERAAWVAVDHYDLDERFLGAIAAAGFRSLAIDDLAAHPFPVDLLVSAAGGRARPYATRADTRRLLGPSYTLIREAYRRARPARPTTRAAGSIVVAFGGSDPEDWTTRIVLALASSERRRRVIAVVGAGYAGDVERLAAARRDVRVDRDVPDLIEPLRDAELMIGAGGGTVWEACCLGVPMIVRPFVDNQRDVVATLTEHGAAVDASGCDTAGIVARLDALTPAEICEMARRAWELVDGEGAARVVDAMTSLVPMGGA